MTEHIEQENLEADQQQVTVETDEQHPKGHISKEDWIAMGRDADEWRSPEVFEERGKWIKRVQELEDRLANGERNTQQQIEQLNQFHQVQMETTIEELKAKRKEAVEIGDSEQFEQIQTQIDQVNAVKAQPAANAGDALLDQWNTNNPWIFDQGPKATYAQSLYQRFAAQGLPTDQVLSLVDQEISRQFPDTNPARGAAPTAEGGSKPGGKRNAGVKLTEADLTAEERKYYAALGPKAFGSMADYLKTVANSRKGV